ncbi:hypothetical protein D3C71_1216040 [compost metagenome]
MVPHALSVHINRAFAKHAVTSYFDTFAAIALWERKFTCITSLLSCRNLLSLHDPLPRDLYILRIAAVEACPEVWFRCCIKIPASIEINFCLGDIFG